MEQLNHRHKVVLAFILAVVMLNPLNYSFNGFSSRSAFHSNILDNDSSIGKSGVLLENTLGSSTEETDKSQPIDIGDDNVPIGSSEIFVLQFLELPKNISFEPTIIDHLPMIINRQQTEMKIAILDTRIRNNWQIYVKLDPSSSNPSNNNTSPLVFIDKNGVTHRLNSEYQVVHTHTGNTPGVTEVIWGANEGLLVSLDTKHLPSNSYSTSVSWSLLDTP